MLLLLTKIFQSWTENKLYISNSTRESWSFYSFDMAKQSPFSVRILQNFRCHLLSSTSIFSELDIMMRNVDYLLVLYHDRKKRSQKGCMTSQPWNFQLWKIFQPQNFQRRNIQPWNFFSTPAFSTLVFQLLNFQPRLLNPRLSNHEHLKPLDWKFMVEEFMVEMFGF